MTDSERPDPIRREGPEHLRTRARDGDAEKHDLLLRPGRAAAGGAEGGGEPRGVQRRARRGPARDPPPQGRGGAARRDPRAHPPARRAPPGRGAGPRGAAHAADPRRHPAGRGAAVRAPRLPAHPHRRHHQGGRHHAAGLLRPLQHQAAAVHRGVQRVRPLDGRPHRAAAGRRAGPCGPPADALLRVLGPAAPQPGPAEPGARRGAAGGRRDARGRAGGAALDHQRTDARPRRPAPRPRRPAGLRRAHGLQPVRRGRGGLHARLLGRRLLSQRRSCARICSSIWPSTPPTPAGATPWSGSGATSRSSTGSSSRDRRCRGRATRSV